MTRINLLPWREELKKERQKNFGIMLAAAAIAGVAAWGIGHLHYEGLISNQETRNQILQQEIKSLDQKIAEIKALEETKTKLLARMDVIQQLQQGRPQVVHLFKELSTTLPDGVYLTSIKQAGDLVTLAGAAESNARISSFMEALDRSPWLTEPVLDVIEVKDPKADKAAKAAAGGLTRLSVYTLRVRQENPNGQKSDKPADKNKAGKTGK